jgi:hypothetical protein
MVMMKAKMGASKMGKVKTAGGSRDGVATKGRTRVADKNKEKDTMKLAYGGKAKMMASGGKAKMMRSGGKV